MIADLTQTVGWAYDPDPMPTVYFTAAEAAKYLKVSVKRIYDLLDENRFAGAAKIDKRWLIPAESVINFQYKPTGRPKNKRGRPSKSEAKRGY